MPYFLIVNTETTESHVIDCKNATEAKHWAINNLDMSLAWTVAPTTRGINIHQLNPSHLVCAEVNSLSTDALQELWETLTPDNVQEFLDLIATVLQEREEQWANRPRNTKE